jgi:glucosylceramidase
MNDNHMNSSVYLTARNTPHRISRLSKNTRQLHRESSVKIHIHLDKTHQTLLGFGGAITEASAHVLSRVSASTRAEAIKACYDINEGLGYTICRTHINSCDFSLGNYSYDNVDGDTDLAHFSIERDRALLIPLLRDATQAAGGDLQIYASPWSPPAWMKTSGQMNAGGSLKPEYICVWAAYLLRYLQEYRKESIELWGMTLQNEPTATVPWDSCVWSAEEQRDFLKDHLGPLLQKYEFGHINLIILDYNRNLLMDWAKTVLSDPEAARYVWGAGVHWYRNEDFKSMSNFHYTYPDKHLLFTEGCQEFGVHIESWAPGERYAHHIIGDLNNWAEGWTDWNIVLDETGGPNHQGNLCSAPIIADTENDRLLYQSSYYYIGHFSKFIRPCAVRLGIEVGNPSVEAVAFYNSDASTAVVVLNTQNEEQKVQICYTIENIPILLPAHSIATVVFNSN